MELRPYLVFKLESALYGFDIESVEEIVELPQLQTISDMSPAMAGLVNFRGEVIQAIDLKYILGNRHKRRYALTDIMVIVKTEPHVCGMIVQDVLDVISLDQAMPWQGMAGSLDQSHANFRFCLGVTELKEELVFILDPLVLYRTALERGTKFDTPEGEGNASFNVSTEDLPIFFDRAQIMLQAPKKKKVEQNTLIVVAAHHEQYGIESDSIEEFCELETITFMPQVSGPILGFINLRGETLPIVDIWGSLQSKKTEVKPHSQVLVVTYKEKLVGILVDTVVGIVKLSVEDLRNVPLTVKSFSEEVTRGLAIYAKRPLAILDLNQLLKYTLAPYTT